MTNLTLVTDLPRGNAEFDLLQDWADRIASVSGGNTTIQVFAAGELVGAFEAIEAAGTGIVDMFYSSPSFSPQLFSGIGGFSLPFSAKIDADAAEAAWNTVNSDAFNESLYGFRFLTAHITGSDVYLAQPSDSDPDGQKVRTAGSEIGAVISSLGGFQITLPAVELYAALSTGVIDAAVVPSYFADQLSLDDITTYFTAPDGVAFAPMLRTLAMKEGVWDELSSSEQALLTAETGLAQSRAFGAQTEALLDAALASAGSTPLPASVVADWEAAIDTLRVGFSSDASDIATAFEGFLSAAGGSSTETGTTGDDTLSGTAGVETILGLAGNDTLNGSLGNDVLDGGTGTDTADYSGAAGAVQLYLSFGKGFGAFGRDTLADIENLIGSDFNDRLIGDSGNNTLTGGAGNDILKGKDGADIFDGGAGDDLLRGGSGIDEMTGGAGTDILLGLSDNDFLEGGDDRDFLYGGRDTDVLYGGAGDDELRGNRGNDTLFGDNGADDLRGGGGSDTMLGGAGDDFLFGENGADVLHGDAGNDVLSGGTGGGTPDGAGDVFIFASTGSGSGGFDRVRDFENGLDRLNLSDFSFTDFATDVLVLASDRVAGLRIDFGGGDVLFLDGFTLAEFDASDVLL